MIELIAVLVILGIVAVVAVIKAMDSQPAVIAEADIMKTNLRFAQIKALTDDTANWGINIGSGGASYSLTKSGALQNTIFLPGENSSTHALPSGIVITAPGAGTFINYDRWGSTGTANITVTLARSGVSSTFTITGNTGFISP